MWKIKMQLQRRIAGDELFNISCAGISKVRAADGDPRGLLWVLDEEMVTPGSNENSVLERVCQYFSGAGKARADAHVRTSSLKC